MNIFHHWSADGKPEAIIFDMDGTLVDTSSIRHLIPKLTGPEDTYKSSDFDAFHAEADKCPALWDNVDSAVNWYGTGRDIIIVTARSEKYRARTESWLHAHYVPYDGLLFMRHEGDMRSDYLVKKDILKALQETWEIVYAVDDNPSIIELWRENGIRTHMVPGWED
jgi:phosphoglycolate phosphatase-like HAD superfamily hydrolase